MADLPLRATWQWLVEAALSEDLGPGDVTSAALIPVELTATGLIEARGALVLAGLEVAASVFERLDVALTPARSDGTSLEPGSLIATLRGPARGILAAERTALNFLQRLSGIATFTARFCDAVGGYGTRIVDTRKTAPGWRTLEKYAVRCGGGINHRIGLYDGILIKDNHVAAVGSVGEAVKRARENAPAHLLIQVEVESVGQASQAIDAGAGLLLVDNQPEDVIAEVVRMVAGRVPVEATGMVQLQNVCDIARTGVDRISIGALTHSAPAVDISLEWSAPSST